MKDETQVQWLYRQLRHGLKINRVNAFRMFGIADLRSRICDVRNKYRVKIQRERVPGKQYLRYWI